MLRLNVNRIRQWLRENERSESWLARKAGLGRATMTRAMACKFDPRLSTIQALSKVTGLKVAELVVEVPVEAEEERGVA